MNERWLVPYFTASSLIHLSLIPVAALIVHVKPIKPVMMPVDLIDVPPGGTIEDSRSGAGSAPANP